MQTTVVQVLLLLVLGVTSRSTMVAVARRTSAASSWTSSDPHNLRSNQLTAVLSDEDYSAGEQGRRVQPFQESAGDPPVEKYRMPKKRTLSLFSRWKTLEQLKKNMLSPAGLSAFQGGDSTQGSSSSRQHKKTASSASSSSKDNNDELAEAMALGPLTFTSDQELQQQAGPRISPRASQRSLRPLGQPLRWG